MWPWGLDQYKYTAKQITREVGDEAWKDATALMQGLGSVDEALPLLKDVVNLGSCECSKPLAPAVRCCFCN
jgi:hypothetical protein